VPLKESFEIQSIKNSKRQIQSAHRLSEDAAARNMPTPETFQVHRRTSDQHKAAEKTSQQPPRMNSNQFKSIKCNISSLTHYSARSDSEMRKREPPIVNEGDKKDAMSSCGRGGRDERASG